MHAMQIAASSRADWLQLRRQGLGASDAPAVLGVCPYRTALEVFYEKTRQGPVPDIELPADDPRTIGALMESVVAKLYMQKTGQRAVEPTLGVWCHPDRPWLRCTPDRLIYRGLGQIGPLEIKTSTTWEGWGPDGSDRVPLNYFVQVQHQMLTLGVDFAQLVVLICGRDLRVYEFTPRLEAWEAISVELTRFWQEHVLVHAAPEPDWGHPRTPDLIRRLYPPTDTTTIALHSVEATLLADAYQKAARQEESAHLEKKEAQARLVMLLGGHESGVLADGRRITNKQYVRRAYHVGETKSVTFRLLPPRLQGTQQSNHDDHNPPQEVA